MQNSKYCFHILILMEDFFLQYACYCRRCCFVFSHKILKTNSTNLCKKYFGKSHGKTFWRLWDMAVLQMKTLGWSVCSSTDTNRFLHVSFSLWRTCSIFSKWGNLWPLFVSLQKMVSMSSSLSLLLDSLLCSLAPLIYLTAQIPELRSCTQHTLVRDT